jgi:hypothetical protein
MGLAAGEAVMAGDIQETVAHGTGVEAGDAVAISGGEAVAANTEANDLAGVASESGDTVVIHGVAVAAVASGVAQGAALTAGNATGTSDGQLIAGDGRGLALSGEGGTWHGMAVPDGYAVVLIS